MRLQELVLAIERELRPNLSLSLRYIHKQLDRGVDDVGLRDEDGVFAFRIANPGFGIASSFVPEGTTTSMPYLKAQRDYDAVEIGLNKRMSNGWAGRFFYLWSRLRGNYSGLASSDFFQNDPNINQDFDSVLMLYDETARPVSGPLATDRPHQIKAQLVYDFRFGTTVGASGFGNSGVPRKRIAGFVPGRGFAVFYDGRESDGCMPFATRLDLQLQHGIRLGDGKSLILAATIFNLFDQGKAVETAEYELFGGQSVAISEAEFFQGFDTQQLIGEQGLVRDPRFLMDRLFQQPRSIRLAARFSF